MNCKNVVSIPIGETNSCDCIYATLDDHLPTHSILSNLFIVVRWALLAGLLRTLLNCVILSSSYETLQDLRDFLGLLRTPVNCVVMSSSCETLQDLRGFLGLLRTPVNIVIRFLKPRFSLQTSYTQHKLS